MSDMPGEGRPQPIHQVKAEFFRVLGHPVRVQIVDLLSRYAGQACVCDIEGQFDLSQPTISHHLRTLREAGILGVEQRGLWAYYYVIPGALEPLQAAFGDWAKESTAR